jgi:hypothetical protein
MNGLRRLSVAFLVAVFAVFPAASARADGGYFFESVPLSARSADQQAIIIHEDGVEALILRTEFRGEPQDYAWVIPTPGLVSPEAVTTVDPAVFDVLDRNTAPAFVREEWMGCLGCGGGGDLEGYPGVTLWEKFQVEGYEVVTISAADSGNFSRWLSDNGFLVSEGAGDIISFYTEKNWKFAAVKVRTQKEAGAAQASGEEAEELRPLRLTFPCEKIVYPLRISAVSTREEAEVLLFVISDHRVEAVNYPTAELDIHIEEAATRYNWKIYYESRFRESLVKSGKRGFVVEYSLPLDRLVNYRRLDYSDDYIEPAEQEELIKSLWDWKEGKTYYLTRLKTRLPAEDMSDDVILAHAASDREVFIEIKSSGLSGTLNTISSGKIDFRSAVWGACLGLVIFFSAYRRSPRVLVRGALFLLLLFLVLI